MGGFPPHEIIIGGASGNHRFQLMLAVFQVPGKQLLDSAAFKRCPLSIGIKVGSDRLAIHEELDGIKIERIPALKCQKNCQSGIGWMQALLLKSDNEALLQRVVTLEGQMVELAGTSSSLLPSSSFGSFKVQTFPSIQKRSQGKSK